MIRILTESLGHWLKAREETACESASGSESQT